MRYRRGIVLGGSLAGMLAARVLADVCDEVVLIERDVYPSSPEMRHGVPQAAHLHLFLMRGQQILDRMFPGVLRDLAAHGAPPISATRDFVALWPPGWSIREELGLTVLPASRALIDFCVRERMRDLPNVRVRERTEVTGLVFNAERTRVEAVELGDGGHEIADWIVDCTGRRSRLGRWLSAAGLTPPEDDQIDSHLGYASRMYTRPAIWPFDWKGLTFLPNPPSRARGGVLFPIEHNRIMVTVSGAERDYPPADEEGFRAFMEGFPSPLLKEAVDHCQPFSDIVLYRATESRNRNFHLMKDFPDRLLVYGDAACCFNPVYGQGMTMAALGAELLSEFFAKPPEHSRTFLRQLGRLNAQAWFLVTSEDSKFEGTTGERPGASIKLLHWFMERLTAAAMTDPQVAKRLFEVYHLLRQPAALLQPHMVLAAVRTSRPSATQPIAPYPPPLPS